MSLVFVPKKNEYKADNNIQRQWWWWRQWWHIQEGYSETRNKHVLKVQWDEIFNNFYKKLGLHLDNFKKEIKIYY